MASKSVGSSAASARRLIVVMTAAVVLFALFAFVALAISERERAYRAAHEAASNTATLLAAQVGRLFDATNLTLDQAILLVGQRSWGSIANSTAYHERLKELAQREFIGSLWLTDETGMPRLTTRVFPAPAVDTSDREYFMGAKLGNSGPMLSRLLRSRVADETNFVMARRIADRDGDFRGIAQAVLDPNYFYNLLDRLKIEQDLEVMLVRDDGAVVLRHPRLPAEAALSLAFTNVGENVEGMPGYRSPADGSLRLIASVSIAGFPVRVVVGAAKARVEQRWRAAIMPHGAYALVAILAVVTFGLGASQATRREQELSESLEETVQDRTLELREALEARDVLLREVNHRIKNNLQIVSSLLAAQDRQVNDPKARQMLGEAQNRIRSIASIHTNLYMTGRYDSVDVRTYMDRLVEDLGASLFDRASEPPISLVCDAFDLPTDAIVPLALIVNELVTNAAKHGYGAGEPGRVEIRIADKGPAFELEVRDYGRGMSGDPDAVAAAGGLGMRLVRIWVEQLHGRMRADAADPGTRFVIEMRKPAPEEEAVAADRHEEPAAQAPAQPSRSSAA